MSRRKGFTLVELLVVIGIIAVLMGILLPVVARAWKAARSTVCLANLQKWGQSYQMYMGSNRVSRIPEQTNEDTALRWWEVLAPYNGNVRASLLCPEAREPRDSSRHPSGMAQHAWRRQTYAVGKPQLVLRGDWLGSYAFNTWLYEHRSPGGTQIYYLRLPSKQPDQIPLIGDCCDPYTLAMSNNRVPKNLEEPEEGISHGEIASFCIDRHRMAVNIVFLDGHAARVPLADLWTLKWSETSQPRIVTVPRP